MVDSSHEKDEFFKFQLHLCKELFRLKKLSTSIDFLKDEHRKVYEDFFFSNLFMLFYSTLNRNICAENRQNIKYMWNKLKLYHYTDFFALEKILSGKSLKLNCILNMNDSGEIQSLIENIHPIFENNNILKDIFCKKTFEYAKNAYSFSFTTLKDDASQWARYGKSRNIHFMYKETPTAIEKSCGICLEIPMQNLKKLVDKIKGNFELAEIIPILYVPNNNRDNTYLKFIKSIINLRISKEHSDEKTSRYVCHYSSAIKHESFKKEYEVRLVLANEGKMPEYINHISNENQRYIIIELAKQCKTFNFTDLISSITLGPETSLASKNEVEKLLQKHNLSSIKLIDSKCTLRV